MLTIQQAFDLAVRHYHAGQLAEAEQLGRQILAESPRNAQVTHFLGVIALQTGRHDEAVELIRQAVALNPSDAAIHNNLGNALRHQGRTEEAVGAFRQAIALRPAYAEAHSNLGNTLAELGRYQEALPVFECALKLQPDLVKARWCYAWSLLILGDFKRGWAWYECRSGLQEWSSRLRQWAELGFTLTKPKWNGEALAGRRILLLVEPGFGDTFQFVRYVPMVAERGGSVILACGSEQLRLFQCLNQYARVITHPPDCEFDVYCPVGSLPQIFKTDLGTIPVTTPYLWAEGELIAKWKARAPREGLRVGVIWSGNAPRTTGRGIALRQLTPLFRVPGVWFVSLQKNEAALQIREAPELAIADWGRELSDFAETAALMANLDLIISIDTATAHLAGALGRPVWTLLPFGADWRWLLNRADSPWYLTMRLFRQPKPGDWETPITQVAQALAAMTGRQGE